MIFNSFHFLYFFIIVTALYFALNHRLRWPMLLISSCYFYMAFVPIYIVILFVTIIIDYFAGIWIEKSQGRRRRLFLICSLAANIGILAIFKYYNFINENLTVLMEQFGAANPVPFLAIALPIGLSFHTFQAMSYTIEVYRGKQPAERNFGIYALYVMFYPQLVAGPIERPQNLLHQFREKHVFEYKAVTGGLKLMVWGLFKKVVIADRLAVYVDNIYADPTSFNSVGLILVTIFFSFQIYCDFSGYSDMAIGAARVMGFKLMTNFNSPYQSRTVEEFWKRWHISLSTWFKDYLYIPLGGNRVTIPRWYLNLFIVFLVSGLWHGASWTFVIWGALHGFYVVFGHAVGSRLRLPSVPILGMLTTFTLVSLAWIFFRAETLDKAWYILSHIFTGLPEVFAKLRAGQSVFQPYGGPSNYDLLFCFGLIALLEIIQYLQLHANIKEKFEASPIYVRWAGYFVLVFTVLAYGIFEHHSFIYFQF